MKLRRRYVEKPWGRTDLPPMFDLQYGQRIGEIWFGGDEDLPLLAKYIFTSEHLSIQVHPSDEQARRRGLASGKTECWYILAAEPDATIGLGLNRELSADELRNAAIDGSIEEAIDWHRVRAGDFFHVPPGTIHAIGPGIALIEFQQNSDVTYRLYDYGRPRELHLDDAVEIASRRPYPPKLRQHVEADEQRTFVSGPPFSFAKLSHDEFTDRRRWILPLEGAVHSDGGTASPGDCLLVAAGRGVVSDSALMLIGAEA